MNSGLSRLALVVTVLATTGLAGCGRAMGEATPAPTTQPPTATMVATATPELPTSTPIPPTPVRATPFPTATDTPLPPTLTAEPSPTDVQLLSQDACGIDQVCYHVRVGCEGIAPREAEIRASRNSDSTGTVMFFSGRFGKGWYGDASDEHAAIIEEMTSHGCETYEIRWLGERGWGTGNPGQGLKKLTCAIAEVVQWIVTSVADNPDAVGATGHSAGSNMLAYGLAVHGLDDILDVVVLTAGPSTSDLVNLCHIGLPGAKWIVDYSMGWLDSGDYCQADERPEWAVRALQEESIVSSIPGELRDYHYPATKVAFVEGEGDPATEIGQLFYDAVSAEKSWLFLEGVGHGVPRDPEGNAAIREALLDGLGITPSGVQPISQSACNNNETCYHRKVDCEGTAPREAEVRVRQKPNSKGSVIFLSGGWGKGWYGDASEHHAGIVSALSDEGYETFEIRWLGEQGWGTDNFGQGFEKLSCGTAEVIRWIATDIADNPDVVGATGHSGGANEIAYGLSVHGLGSILDVVVLSGGPGRVDLVELCCGDTPMLWQIVDYAMGWQDNGDYCQVGCGPEWTVQALEAESIVSSLAEESRDYHYRNTRVAFIEGELDIFSDQGQMLYEAITSEKSWVVVPGVGHGVPADPGGASRIAEMLLEGLGSTD